MKRFLLVLGLVVGLVAVILVSVPGFFGSHAKIEWKALPGGGEVSIFRITQGVTHRMELSRPPLSEQFSQSIRGQSLRPFFEDPPFTEFSSGSHRSIGVWFLVRGRSKPRLSDFELILPDGQKLYDIDFGRSWNQYKDGYLAHGIFPVVPYTTKRLRVAALWEDQQFEWEIDNPAYAPITPQWNAEQIPSTREVGEFKITLAELKIENASNYRSNWLVRPKFNIVSQSKDVSSWFSLNHEISDPGGNKMNDVGLLSAPVWKITTHLTRSSNYPYARDEVEWIGSLGKSAAEALAPQQYTIFPLGATDGLNGIKMVGIFSPGRYDILHGTVVHAEPAEPKKTTSIEGGKGITLRVNLPEAACLVFRKNKSGNLQFLDQAGEPIQLKSLGDRVGFSGRLMIFQLPESPVQVGIADQEMPVTLDRSVEFFVNPPQIPGQEGPAQKP